MSEVFSTPCVPVPDADEFSQFFTEFLADMPSPTGCNSHQAMLMQQPPEQPLFDCPEHRMPNPLDASTAIVKQEQETGFLSAWSHLSLDQKAMEIDRCSPEAQKLIESHFIKEELHCHLKLKMLKEGKDLSMEAEDQTMQQDYPISEETRELQRIRRQKNREAAKKCRQKKRATEREQEQKIRECEKQVQDMKLQIQQSQAGFYDLLQGFNLPCFLAYLRQNKQLVRNPVLKPVLQKFVQSHGGQMSTSVACDRVTGAWCTMSMISGDGLAAMENVEQ